MGILSLIGGAIKPITELVDSLHTSEEEKRELHVGLVSVENKFAAEVLAYEAKITSLQASVIMTEAKGDSWLQRSWRPITMLTFLSIIVMHYLGLLAFPIAEQMWDLLKIGIGGYIGSRGVEKVLPAIMNKTRKD